jgi:hypothetical protein
VTCQGIILAGLVSASAIAERQPIGRFVQTGKVIMPSATKDNYGNDLVASPWADLYRTEIGPRLNSTGKINHVFYPLGGPDISHAFALFTNA